MKLPPYDSWIRLGAGERVSIDAETQKKWHEDTAAFRQIRGSVLVAVFEIEYSLDRILEEVLFPGHDSPSASDRSATQSKLGIDLQHRSGFFDDLFLKSAPLGLSRKARILKEIAGEVQSLSDRIPKDLFECIGKVNDVRSRFAHYPVSFVPVSDAGRQVLQGRLTCKNQELILDEPYLSSLSTLLSKVKSDLDQLMRYLTS